MKFHKATNLGIEIEICVEKEKYKSLKNSKNLYSITPTSHPKKLIKEI